MCTYNLIILYIIQGFIFLQFALPLAVKLNLRVLIFYIYTVNICVVWCKKILWEVLAQSLQQKELGMTLTLIQMMT